MATDSSTIQGTVILAPEGRLDSQTTKGFAELLGNAMKSGSNRIILDLSRVVYITSDGLRGILTTAKEGKSLQKSFIICGPSGAVKDVLEISGFNRMIPMFPTLDAALKG